MYPFLHLFGRYIATYYVCAATAGIVGFLLAAFTLRKKLPGAGRWILPLITVVSAIIGARLLNVLINPKGYGEGFRAWSLQYKNLSLMGGLATGILAILTFCLLARKDPRGILDAFVLPAASGIVILKIGCFLNGCCGGKSTKVPWGVEFPGNKNTTPVFDPLHIIVPSKNIVHPTQVYEIIGALIALVLALVLSRLMKKPGVSAAAFSGAFAVARWIVLPFRALSYPKYVIHILYPILYGSVALLCLAFVLWSARRRHVDTTEVGISSRKLDCQ
ncbi:MAG: prolipoprotein diacylglyceryl transferase [Clostridiales bacterium]|nr:prolipoprotein diacylglyceryl transferase [Clostridiales bacterium]